MKSCTLFAGLAFAIIAPLVPTPSVGAAEPIVIAVKFPPGQIDRQTTVMENEQIVSGTSKPAPEKQSWKSTTTTRLRGTSSDASGNSVELTYESIQIAIPNLGKTVSAEKERTLSAITGAKLMLHFTRAGKVDRVDGVDAILAKLPADSALELKPVLDGERIMALFNEEIETVLPTKPVKIGETWVTEVSRKTSGVNVRVTTHVTLAAVNEVGGHKIAKLKFTGKSEVEAGVGPSVPKVTFERYDQSGTSEFDITRGWFASHTVELHIKARAKINPETNPESIEVEQTYKYASKQTPVNPEAAIKPSTKPETAPVNVQSEKVESAK